MTAAGSYGQQERDLGDGSDVEKVFRREREAAENDAVRSGLALIDEVVERHWPYVRCTSIEPDLDVQCERIYGHTGECEQTVRWLR